MWIGYPWDLREIRNPARGLHLVKATSQGLMTTLSGAYRATSRPETPRRWAATFPWMTAVEADWLRYLAARLDGPGPLAIIDPSTRNYLSPLQSVGRGNTRRWTPSNGTLTRNNDGTVAWNHNDPGTLTWVNPAWPHGWPARPGETLTFQHAGSETAHLVFRDRSGTTLATIDGSPGTVTATTPQSAVYASPHITATAGGTLTIPRACLSRGPVPEPWPAGEHIGAVFLVNPDEVVERLPHRTVTLELQECF